MKTPIEFDYDLWTTEDGKCMVRVKSTGEVTEVDRDVMRLLRAEEKKLRRSMTGVPISGCEDETATILTLDYVSYQGGEDMTSGWLEDKSDFTEEILNRLVLSEFVKQLTPKQQKVFKACIVEGKSSYQYAKEAGIRQPSVFETLTLIRKKAKKFF